jgi:hypothetical protein
MADDNKRNLLYFEGASMPELYDTMSTWQDNNRKRLLSVNIQQDQGKFCCIALTNPTEVVIMDGRPYGGALVLQNSLSVME